VMRPYRPAPGAQPPEDAPPRELTARDIDQGWLVMALIGLSRLLLAFARGEPPFSEFPLSEPGLAFIVFVVALPLGARALMPAGAGGVEAAAERRRR
jgi:hypothetical protein